MTRLAVVVGSVRPNRVGGAIAQWVVDQANEIEGVEAEIVEHGKGKKVDILKYKNKTGYKVRQGHRQQLTTVKITGIK